jgi:hypothetical protein
MPVPTVADVDADGDLEIVVSLKDALDHVRQLQVYTVPGSSANCLPWPTGRGNWRRSGYTSLLPAAFFSDNFESGGFGQWSPGVGGS